VLTRLISLVFLAFILACGDDNGGTTTPSPTDSSSPTVTSPGPTGDAAGQGTWETLAPMPTPRAEVAVAAVSGLIYVVGGFEASGSASQKVEVYDPATDSWSEVPSLPAPRHHTAAVEWEGDLLVIGGYQTGFGDPKATVYRYDPDTEEWSENPRLVEARGGHAAVILDSVPVIVGGEDGSGTSLTSAEWMDSISEEWHVFDDEMNARRDHLAAATASSLSGDQLVELVYAIGGRLDIDYGRNLGTNESAGIIVAEWTEHAPLPTARSGIAAATVDNRIYVFGGEGPEGSFDESEVYDPANDTWSAATPMPTARHGLGAAVVDGVIYVIGGGPTPGLSVSGVNEAFRP
jgi:N-acetylneuraminic acid mutarotase